MSIKPFRYVLKGTLVADSALFIGGPGERGFTDLIPVRNGLEQIIIPGSSLAGVLRSELKRRSVEQGTLWGGNQGEVDVSDAQASQIFVDDAVVKVARMEVRDGVAIDRVSGAAAHGQLFTREVVIAGTEFDFTITALAESKTDSYVCELMRHIAALLLEGITIGAAGSRGFGRLKTDKEKRSLKKFDFTSPEGLFEALGAKPLGEVIPLNAELPPPDELHIKVPWSMVGSVMSSVGSVGTYIDSFPATTQVGQELRLLLPGSSIKGAFRSHAEKIMRTLTDAAPLADENFSDVMELAEKLPAVKELFGTPGDHGKNNPGYKGVVRFSDVVSKMKINREKEHWAAVQETKSSNEEQSREDCAKAVVQLNDSLKDKGLWFDLAVRNSIDRWTGAAAEGRLFTSLEPYALGEENIWENIVLKVDVAGLKDKDENINPGYLVLLLLLLRDFAEGWIPLGAKTTRGLGSVFADQSEITFTYSGTDKLLESFNDQSLQEILNNAELLNSLNEKWQQLVKSAEVT